MLDRIRDRKPLRAGAQKALLHFARAGYEVVTGIGAFVEEIVSTLREDVVGEEKPGSEPQRIEVE